MGRELETTVRVGKAASECRVLLESAEIICRGGLTRRFPRAGLKGVRVRAGWLEFASGDETVGVKLGAQAPAWLEAIRNPRSRIDKLGVAPGMRVCVLGRAEADALAEIGAALGRVPARRLAKGADVVVMFASEVDDLERLGAIESSLAEGGGVWVLWEKGRTDLRHEEVVDAGRGAGLSQTKSMGFSEVFTGLRLVRATRAR